MIGYEWISKDLVIALHGEQLSEHGGPEGIRDMGALESALERPKDMFANDECADHAILAAAYAFEIAKNNPFLDGKKRVAFLSAELFLELNGFQLTANDKDCAVTIIGLADGTLPEDELVKWFQANAKAA
jgi:death on curing protein